MTETKTLTIKGITFTVDSETDAYYLVSTPLIRTKTGARKVYKVMK